MVPPLQIEVNAFTHQGRWRESNEDSITVGGWVSDVAMTGPRRSRHDLTEPFLVAVADGMGGHAAGEVASRYAIKRLAAEPFAGGEGDVTATLDVPRDFLDLPARRRSWRGRLQDRVAIACCRDRPWLSIPQGETAGRRALNSN